MRIKEQNLENVFCALAESKFRARFTLHDKELRYLHETGPALIERHAREFVTSRLAPSSPKNDGKQTPMKNHPVFIAQHATATCCRKCLEKWHRIKTGEELTDDQIDYVVTVIMYWIKRQYHKNAKSV